MPATVTQLHNNPPAPVASTTTGSLTERAMLVGLHITKPSLRKTDKGLNLEIAKNHGSDVSMHRVSRLLVSKDALSEINKIAAEAREFYHEATSPWNALRIMTSMMFFEFSDRQRRFKQAFDDAAERFATEWDMHVQEAKRLGGDLFDVADYPRADTIRTMFSFEVNFYPLPDENDFRVKLGDEALDSIKQDYRDQFIVSTEEAMKDVWGRIYEQVSHMVERLNAFKPAVKDKTTGKTEEKAEGIFRDSLVDNLRGLADVLPRLNLTGSAELDAMTQRLRDELCGADADTLRKDERARENVAIAAERILTEVQEFLA